MKHRDVLSRCGIINILSAGSKYRLVLHNNSAKLTFEARANEHSREFLSSESLLKIPKRTVLFPKRRETQTASKEAGGNCEECDRHQAK